MNHSPGNRRRRRGFTLIEILVVVAILLMLIAMVAPRVLRQRETSDINVARTQIHSLQRALDLYVLDCRRYPSTEDGLRALIERPADLAETVPWSGPYLDSDTVPLDPWGNEFQYEYPPTRGTRADRPNIWSFGPDGEDGTEDDITSWTGEDTLDAAPMGDPMRGNDMFGPLGPNGGTLGPGGDTMPPPPVPTTPSGIGTDGF